MNRRPISDVSAFSAHLKTAKNIVVLTGAGVSAESGVPTFRGAGGYWRQYQAQNLACPQAFRRDPSLVWEFYHYRREVVLTKQPNQAHISLVEFEKKLRNEGRRLVVITQNIDELHLKAGTKNVIELHGSLFKTLCVDCGDIASNYNSPICPALKNKGAPDESAVEARIPLDQLPRCVECSGLLRPYVVWFGEALEPQVLQAAKEELDMCDLCLVVGTSAIVYPAALFAPDLAKRGVPVAEFNIEPTPNTQQFGYYFEGPCGTTLPQVAVILLVISSLRCQAIHGVADPLVHVHQPQLHTPLIQPQQNAYIMTSRVVAGVTALNRLKITSRTMLKQVAPTLQSPVAQRQLGLKSGTLTKFAPAVATDNRPMEYEYEDIEQYIPKKPINTIKLTKAEQVELRNKDIVCITRKGGLRGRINDNWGERTTSVWSVDKDGFFYQPSAQPTYVDPPTYYKNQMDEFSLQNRILLGDSDVVTSPEDESNKNAVNNANLHKYKLNLEKLLSDLGISCHNGTAELNGTTAVDLHIHLPYPKCRQTRTANRWRSIAADNLVVVYRSVTNRSHKKRSIDVRSTDIEITLVNGSVAVPLTSYLSDKSVNVTTDPLLMDKPTTVQLDLISIPPTDKMKELQVNGAQIDSLLECLGNLIQSSAFVKQKKLNLSDDRIWAGSSHNETVKASWGHS
ncbi:NAD-dependent protein deacylase sirtuin-5, mitochondrial [Chamberlinius hualienensis]